MAKITVENSECNAAVPLGLVMLKKQTVLRLDLKLPFVLRTYTQGDFSLIVKASEEGDWIDVKGGIVPDLFVCGVASNSSPAQDWWLAEGRVAATGRVVWRKLVGPGDGFNHRAYGVAADHNKIYVAGTFDPETAGTGKFYVEARSVRGGGKVWEAYSGVTPAVGYAYCVTEHNGFIYVGGHAQLGDGLPGAWSYLIQKRNAATGALIWERHALNIAAHPYGHTPAILSISVLGNFVYTVGRVREDTGFSSMSKAALLCLNDADGTTSYEQTLTAYPAESEYRAVVAYDGALYIGGSVEQAVTPLAWYSEKRTLAGSLTWGNFSVEAAEGGVTGMTLAKDVTDPLKRRLFIVGALNVGAPLYRSYWRTEERDMITGDLLLDYVRVTSVSDYATGIATDDNLGAFVVGQVNTVDGEDKLSVGKMTDNQAYEWFQEPVTTFSTTTQATGVALRPRS